MSERLSFPRLCSHWAAGGTRAGSQVPDPRASVLPSSLCVGPRPQNPRAARSFLNQLCISFELNQDTLVTQKVKNLPGIRETQVRFPSWKDSLEKGMATQSKIIAWRIPRLEESGGLQPMGSQRVGHNWGACTLSETYTHFL